jgi:hypothetical protein
MDSDRTSRTAVETSADLVERTPNLARVLIKGWRPAAEMGVGCTSEGGGGVSSGAYCAPRFAGCGIPSQTAPSRSPAKYFSPVDQCKNQLSGRRWPREIDLLMARPRTNPLTIDCQWPSHTVDPAKP